MTSPALKHSHREEAILEHIDLVRTIARRLAQRLPPSVELSELINIGILGLLDAWDRYDPERGVAFKTYAELRIKGQMIDALRRDDWVPRSARKKLENLTHTKKMLSRRLGRSPTQAEVQNELGMDAHTFESYCADANLREITSLDVSTTEEGSSRIIDQIAGNETCASEQMVRQELREAVARAVNHLPPRERTVVTLSYLEDLTLREIGTRLGVTESRVCQLRSQGVQRLRFRLRQL